MGMGRGGEGRGREGTKGRVEGEIDSDSTVVHPPPNIKRGQPPPHQQETGHDAGNGTTTHALTLKYKQLTLKYTATNPDVQTTDLKVQTADPEVQNS